MMSLSPWETESQVTSPRVRLERQFARDRCMSHEVMIQPLVKSTFNFQSQKL